MWYAVTKVYIVVYMFIHLTFQQSFNVLWIMIKTTKYIVLKGYVQMWSPSFDQKKKI